MPRRIFYLYIVMIYTSKQSGTAVILAGGKARRFGGKQKPLVHLKGLTLLEHQLQALEKLFDDILLITNHPDSYRSFGGFKTHHDIMVDKGPLGGIHSAMHHAGSSHVFTVAGDMPFLQKTAISKLMQLSQQHPRHAVIPYAKQGPEPLFAVYPVAVKEQLEYWLRTKNDLSVKSFLNQIPVHYWQTDVSTPFININTPEELQYYETFPLQRD